MADETPTSSNQESRPVDLGLSEGKSMGFAPTGALGPEAFPIGGSQPIETAPQGSASPSVSGGDAGGTAPQAAPPAPSPGGGGED